MTVLPKEPTEETLTRVAAASLLGVRESQLRRWEAAGRLRVAGHVPAGKLPRVLYYKAEVMQLKAERDLLDRSSDVLGGAASS